MSNKMNGTLAAMMVLLIGILSGCGLFGGDGPSLEGIPIYPNAMEGESMEQSVPGGFIGGKMTQYTTTDTFDEVMDYYAEALGDYEAQVMSHTSELGRQVAISIPQDNGIITVSVRM